MNFLQKYVWVMSSVGKYPIVRGFWRNIFFATGITGMIIVMGLSVFLKNSSWPIPVVIFFIFMASLAMFYPEKK